MLLEQMFELETIGLDQMSVKFLSDGLGSQAGEKFDYIKFRKAIKALKGMNMDMNTAIQSTLTTASTMGVQSSDIYQSASKFLDLIDSEEDKFNVALQRQSVNKIDEKKIALDESKQKILEIKNKLIELQNDISKEENLQLILQSEIEKNQTMIQDKKQLFHESIQKIKLLVQEDLNSLK